MGKKIEKNDHAMTKMIHKCLRCNKMAYEISNGLFKCSNVECGFEWEVINCGE